MFRNIIFFVIFVFFQKTALAQPCREVHAYFPSWKWHDRNHLVCPGNLDYSKYTAINYAFFQPNADGSISPFDPGLDKRLLLGEVTSSAPSGYLSSRSLGNRSWHFPGTSLVELAHERGVKVLISVGGWTLSEHFSAISANPEKRRRFAQSCNQLIRTYGIDGIDLDWEYPGYQANGGSPGDRHNFTLLLEAIRDSLDALTLENSKRLLLTSAFGVSPERMADIEWSAVTPLLDFINLMTYDFYGRDFAKTNHHAPLYAPATGIKGYDTHSVVHHLMERYGVPPEKINIGIPFYGKSMCTGGAAELHARSKKSPDSATFPEDAGTPMFYNILARRNKFDYNWDERSQSPWLRGRGSLHTFVSFDDERSIAQKARYVLDHRLAGVIVWDITGDYVETSSGSGIVARTPLADALANALCGKEAEIVFQLEAPSKGESSIEMLPSREILIKKKDRTPRLSGDQESGKKSKKEKRKERKRKKKMKEDEAERYFDGG